MVKLADQAIHHGLDSLNLRPASVGIVRSTVAPKIPTAVGIRCRSLRLRIQDDNVVAGSPAIIAPIPDEVVVDAVHVLVAAMKSDMKATLLGGTLGRDIEVANTVEADTLLG